MLAVSAYTLLKSELFYVHSFANIENRNLTDLWEYTDSAQGLSGRDVIWTTLYLMFLKSPLFGIGFFAPLNIVYQDIRTNVFFAHNYFFTILTGGGLFLFIPTIVFYAFITFRSFKVIKKNSLTYLGVQMLLMVIIINLTNTYYAHFFKGPLIWFIFGAGIFLIFDRESLARER